MKKSFWKIIYSLILLPLLFGLAHVLSIFSKPIRDGLYPRRTTIANLQKWMNTTQLTGRRILFHAASLGEFEHIKPLMQKLKEEYKTVNILTLFSPSGYKNINSTPGLDYFMYMPIDLGFLWKKVYEIIQPDLLVISKHDVWPMQIWQAKKMKIPIYLVNGSLAENSSRTKPLVKSFQKYIYRDFTNILAISEDDAKRFSIYYPKCHVKVVGDTKYDQVLFRKKASADIELIPPNWLNKNRIFIAGSIWPEDEEKIFPVFKRILKESKNFRLILAPHEPKAEVIRSVEKTFSKWGTQRFTQVENIGTKRILIINTIGHLADLYKYAMAAYVGGSFKQGIHNVMEPAIYGIPVIFGPEHKESYEAIELAKAGGGIVIKNENDFEVNIDRLLNNKEKCNQIGKKALTFSEQNTGATLKIINQWKEYLK